MKTVLLTCCISFLISCNKSVSEKPDALWGKWQIQKRYDGYANGGFFRWYEVPADQKFILEFNQDGTFKRIETIRICTGTYSVLNEGKIKINSDCNIGPYENSVQRIPPYLILIQPVREGVVKEKFMRIR